MIAFAGTVPENYERYLRPILFGPYAEDLAERLTGDRILEIACGTGILTRAILERRPRATIVATDLNPGMIEIAKTKVQSDRVTWRQADAMKLPFGDAEFDAAVCQLGFMFVPDKLAAFREARRVLRPSGTFLFSVWDSLAENDASRLANDVVASMFASDPPRFMYMPFSMHDRAEIEQQLRAAGFRDIDVMSVDKTMEHNAARQFAAGMVRGTPMLDHLRERDADLDRVIEETSNAIASHPGDLRMRMIVVEAR